MTEDFFKNLKESAQKFKTDPIESSLNLAVSGREDLLQLLEIVSLPQYFDTRILKSILPDYWKEKPSKTTMDKTNELIQSLFELSFVVELPQSAGGSQKLPNYKIDRTYRSKLLEHWKNPERRDELVKLSKSFRDYFKKMRKRSNYFEDAILEREELYHNLVINENEALRELQTVFQDNEDSCQLGVCQTLVNLAAEQAQFFKEDKNILWLRFFEGRLDLSQGELKKARETFEAIQNQPNIEWLLKVRTTAALGEVSAADGDWSQAMQEYEKSVTEFLKNCTNTGNFDSLMQTFHVKKRQTNNNNIKECIESLEDQLTIVRILNKMGDLALAMAEPAKSVEYGGTRKVRYVDTREEELALTGAVHKRLQTFAEQTYRQALKILEEPNENAQKTAVSAAKETLERKASFGLANVLLAQGKKDDAESLLRALLESQNNQHEEAEIMLALGDCSLFTNQAVEATRFYEKAAAALENSWDRPTWAKTALSLGRAKAMQKDWQPAIEYLKKSRQIYSELHNERQEEKAQETFRALARNPNLTIPTEIRDKINEEIKSWQNQHFAYPASSSVLNRVKKIWWQIFAAASISLSLLYFLTIRTAGRWFLGLFGAKSLISPWWADILLFIFCLISAIMHVSIFADFRRQIGRFLPLNKVYGSQPELITTNSVEFTHVDSEGETRKIPWNTIRELRNGYSSRWIVGEANLTSYGTPGGRILIMGNDGALAVDSDINSYWELEKEIVKKTPESVQESKQFDMTFRSTGRVMLVVTPILALFGIPILFVLTFPDQSFLMLLIKILAGVIALLLLGGIWILLGKSFADSIRMRSFLYPLRTRKPPPSEYQENQTMSSQ